MRFYQYVCVCFAQAIRLSLSTIQLTSSWTSQMEKQNQQYNGTWQVSNNSQLKKNVLLLRFSNHQLLFAERHTQRQPSKIDKSLFVTPVKYPSMVWCFVSKKKKSMLDKVIGEVTVLDMSVTDCSNSISKTIFYNVFAS